MDTAESATAPSATAPASRRGRGTGTSAAVRRHNMSQVLRVVHRFGHSTRSDISRLTGLSRPAVTSLVADLTALGYLTDTDSFASGSRGRPRMGVALARRRHAVVAVDIRVDRTVVEVVDLCGDVLRHRRLPHDDDRDAAALVAALAGTIRRSVAKAAVPVVGIGIAAPSDHAPTGEDTLSSPYLKLSGVPLAAALGSALKPEAPRVGMADVAHCAAIANLHALAVPGPTTLAHIQVGAGAGLGVAGSGAEFVNRHPERIRIGHLPLDPQGPPCTCGARGCFDAIAGFPAFVASTRSLDIAAPPTLATMREYCRSVADLAAGGDGVAVEAIRTAAGWAGRAAACVLNLLGPDRLTLGGYPLYLGETYRRSFLEAIAPFAPHPEETVTTTALDDDAPARGAAILAMQSALDDAAAHPGTLSL